MTAVSLLARAFCLLWGAGALLACADAAPGRSGAETSSASQSGRYSSIVQDTTLQVDGLAVTIRVPVGPVKADLLVLPGWNYSRTDWCEKTDMCQQALARGYRLVLPEMHRSLYASRYFPETRADFRQERTRPWVWDTLIGTLAKQYGILDSGGVNVVLGLSTGAHGASLLCLDRPGYFCAAACLSGDYDLPRLHWDRITIATYGPHDQFPDRWTLDNPCTLVRQWQVMALYLGHGTLDKVIPAEQSRYFYDALLAQHPHLKDRLVLHLAPGKAHDYAYWGSETPAVLDFLDIWASKSTPNR
ncbi:MAG: alpha/beta hydrolase [Bacteroidetes bacterium]|nr:alpha/beta hydrolase [Bacteroidota bacterium]